MQFVLHLAHVLKIWNNLSILHTVQCCTCCYANTHAHTTHKLWWKLKINITAKFEVKSFYWDWTLTLWWPFKGQIIVRTREVMTLACIAFSFTCPALKPLTIWQSYSLLKLDMGLWSNFLKQPKPYVIDIHFVFTQIC